MVRASVRSYVATTAAMIAVTVALAIACAWLASAVWWRALLAAAIAIAAGAVAGIALAGTRAIAAGLVTGLGAIGLGRRAVALVFERALSLGDDRPGLHGERGTDAARAIERLPLAQAESRITRAVAQLSDRIGEGGGFRGWLARRVERAVVRWTGVVTLAHLRETGQQHGGVDLLMARDELAAAIDGLLMDQVASKVRLTTAGYVAATFAISLGAAFALRAL